MQKSINKIFAFLYKLILKILEAPSFLIKYFFLGIFYTVYFLVLVFLNLTLGVIKYNIYGLVYISFMIFSMFKMIFKLLEFLCYVVYVEVKYFFKGILTIFVFILLIFKKIINFIKIEKKPKKIKIKKVKKIKEKNNIIINEPIIDDKIEIVEEVKDNKKSKKKKDDDVYLNENLKLERKKISKIFKDFFNSIRKVPASIINKFKNNDFAKHKRNKKTMQREALLIDFDSEDAEKSDTKILYQYVAKDNDEHIIKDFFEAFSKVEVHSFLLSEGYDVYSIKKASRWTIFVHGRAKTNNVKIKIKDLTFFITQLSTYLKAGIPLVEALRILARQFKDKRYQKIFKAVVYDLTMGDNFSDALTKQNVAFPRLFINMVKTAEMTGELPEVLDDMYNYYTETEKTRKQMITALMYPSLVFIFSIAVITFIMMFVIPQFVEIYSNMDADKIPIFTKIVISVSAFLQNYIIYLLIGIIVVIFMLVYLYKHIRTFRTVSQWLMMHMPIFGKTIIYNEVTMFTKTFSSLLSHNVFITESMEILNKITNNEVYKMLILDTITNLAKGDKISSAFKGHWAFPVPAYEMLVTGEKTGELSEMMGKVSTYYQELHKESVSRIKTFVEPALTIFLTVVVGIIILAIIIPMFGMYGTIQDYG